MFSAIASKQLIRELTGSYLRLELKTKMAVKVELSSQKLFGFVLPAGLDAELIKQSVLAGLAAVLLSIFSFWSSSLHGLGGGPKDGL